MNLFKKESDWFTDYKTYNNQYVEKEFSQNRILTDTVKLSLNSHKTKRDNNVFVIANKEDANSYLLSNILQVNTNYIVPDIGGKIYRQVRDFLEHNGYTVKTLNFINFQDSEGYNPFNHFIYEDGGYHISIAKTILPLFNKEDGIDSFQETNEKCLLISIINYIIENMPVEKHNFTSVFDLLNLVDFEKENSLELLDDLFGKPEVSSRVFKYYKIFKVSSKKNVKEVVLSLAERLHMLKTEPVKNLVHSDTLQLEKYLTSKQVLFMILPERDTRCYPIANMIYTQLLERLYVANCLKPNRHVKMPIMCVVKDIRLNFPDAMYDYNNHGLHFSVITPSIKTFQNQYKENWDSILANCDSVLYMSGQSQEDFEYVSDMLGSKTCNRQTFTIVEKSKEMSQCLQPKPLMTTDEVAQLPTNKCILIIRGLKPFYSDKYCLNKHPNFKYLKR